MKLGGGVYNGPRRNPSHFRVDPSHRVDEVHDTSH